MKPIVLNNENFERSITDTRTPVLVDFWAEWCGPCKMLAPVLDQVAEETEGRATIAKVNIDEHPELARQYGIQSIPTLVVFKEGQPDSRLVGLASKRDILKALDLN